MNAGVQIEKSDAEAAEEAEELAFLADDEELELRSSPLYRSPLHPSP